MSAIARIDGHNVTIVPLRSIARHTHRQPGTAIAPNAILPLALGIVRIPENMRSALLALGTNDVIPHTANHKRKVGDPIADRDCALFGMRHRIRHGHKRRKRNRDLAQAHSDNTGTRRNDNGGGIGGIRHNRDGIAITRRSNRPRDDPHCALACSK